MIVKILEVWFISSVPIGIAVGRFLERSSIFALASTRLDVSIRRHQPTLRRHLKSVYWA